jgi:AcrR family transcriptional regulator
MPRTSTSRTRADGAARTRARIIEVTREALPGSGELSVDAIAAAAGVSVQTLYTHFGSKRGLLLAVIDTAQREAGLYLDFDRIWSSEDGETALRRMLEATLRVWAGLWPLVRFSERVRRADPEIEQYLREVDGYRLANLRSITDQLALEGRLQPSLDAEAAADIAFAMSMPAIYQQLVVVRGWSLERTSTAVVDAIIASVVNASVAVDPAARADWSGVLRPGPAMSLDPTRRPESDAR